MFVLGIKEILTVGLHTGTWKPMETCRTGRSVQRFGTLLLFYYLIYIQFKEVIKQQLLKVKMYWEHERNNKMVNKEL